MSMRVTVRGAGIIGLSVAEELLRRGHLVRVVDPAPARGASFAAAGMLSPAAEVWHGEHDVLRLGLASLALWPDLAQRLDVPLVDTGTLLVGVDAGDLQQVRRQADLLARHGVQVEEWSRRQVVEREPSLDRVAGGVWVPGEGSVNPREVCAALLERVRVEPEEPTDWRADVTVIATGSVLPEPHRHLVRGVRGEILRLRTDDPPSRTVRGWVSGEPVYLVPRRPEAAGPAEVVVGATSEEHDGLPVVTAGGVLRLLAAARVVWPALDRAELVETTARDRPGTLDGLPLIGPTERSGEWLAAGHYRHGVLLAPLTARLIAEAMDDPRSAVDAAVDPRRFTSRQPGGIHAPHAQR
ncbi:FAD-dependent oxidoreductase [Aeromicrobium sp. Sec7.5]|uniref:FAD-dependent oxidoreductase n=1 Tax=Aeromicrobium sp. Sec7.5 TaxID=3121276 RepID=UPI002FE493F7